MSDIRTYAAFVKNYVNPMIDRLSDLVWYAEKQGIPITKESLSELTEKVFLAHIVSVILQGIIHLILAGIVCWTVIRIL